MTADCGCDARHDDSRALDNSAWDGAAAMSGCASSSTPGSCYAALCAGRKAGDAGLHSSWALPHHKTPGGPANAAGVRNALARLPQTQGLTNAAAARRHLEAHLGQQANSAGDWDDLPQWELDLLLSQREDMFRSVPFELTCAEDGGDGLTLEGYAAVFNRTALIKDFQGEFEEQIAPGAFADSLARRTPVLMFEHGRHPLIGSMPLGRITDAHEDSRGLFISARLSDNWLIQPVRDAVRDKAVTGMSFRFASPADDEQRWVKRNGKPDLRTLLRLDVPELGPVVFPAYEPTTATVRSLLDGIDTDFTGRDGARSTSGGEHEDGQPGTTPAATIPTRRAQHNTRALELRGIR